MNRFAYRTTGLAIKTLSGLSRARVRIHGRENIPAGSLVFVINHFTRIETILLPYHIFRLTGIPTWSLADDQFFKGSLGAFLDRVGAVSTRDPDRDRLMVKTLLTGEATWIIYPEGRMVKNKKMVERGRYMISSAGGKHPPHTGAATLAIRAEFYRQRLKALAADSSGESRRLLDLFRIESMDSIADRGIFIVPVNLTYYPLRARENLLSHLARWLVGDISERMAEELMTEGSMLLSGVDVDMRFGKPIDIGRCLNHAGIGRDISSTRPFDFDDSIPSRRALRRIAQDVMQRYMASIYGMTTVNHDHLFAALLRMSRQQVNPDDLKRRVYFAATHKLDQTGVYLHQDLEAGQLHLLTDDRFRKYRDFFSVALAQGVVAENGSELRKNRSRFESAFGFHRARLDTPVAVMANEIEPLTKLQRYLRRISWMPSGWIRKKIFSGLAKRIEAEFERDYREYHLAGESKPMAVGQPFLYKRRYRGLGVVLVHGYLAAPAEVRELAAYLAATGYCVLAPRLKGHGTSPDDLAQRTYRDWIRSVDEAYAMMRCLCRRVVVGGFSTGAGLALDLAARVGDVAGVFAISPPVSLQDISSRLVPAVDGWNKIMKRVRLEGARKEFVENVPEHPHINYLRNPVAGIRELERLMESVEARLADIDVPALIVQSHGDPVVDPKGSRRAFDLLGSRDKQYLLVNFERHGIILGEGAVQVHRAVADFVDRLR